METGSNLVFKHFNCFGLQIHIDSKSKPSEIECVFFTAPGHFKLPTLPSTELPTDSSSSLLVIPKHKKDNGETRQKRHDQMYDDAKGKNPIPIGEFGMITFMRHFKYLGSYISYSLNIITTLNTEYPKLLPQWEISTVFGLTIQSTIFQNT